MNSNKYVFTAFLLAFSLSLFAQKLYVAENGAARIQRSNHKVTHYNRWGDKAFEIEDYDNNQRVFTGLSDDGGNLPSGIYFYRVEFPSGRPQLEGYLTLKR